MFAANGIKMSAVTLFEMQSLEMQICTLMNNFRELSLHAMLECARFIFMSLGVVLLF
jgi:hypothetical protein